MNRLRQLILSAPLATIRFVLAVGAWTLAIPDQISLLRSPAYRRHLWTKSRTWSERHRRQKVAAVLVVFSVVATLQFIHFGGNNYASAMGQGDGVAIYGVSANTNPQLRTYTGSSNTFGSAGGTVAGTAPLNMTIRTSPTKTEAIAGYVTSGGVLQIMCYDGSAWTNDWSVTVGGTGTSRRFDIAYETSSGDAVVLYSTNASSTNELAYRTKIGTAGCGTASWLAASNFDPVRTSSAITWIAMASDRRSSSNLASAIFADGSGNLSAITWSGTGWGNEPSTVLEGSLNAVSASQDIMPFDIEYESLSGDVMTAWGESGNGAGKLEYRACTGGTANCTWGSITDIDDTGDSGHVVDLSANPLTDEIIMGAIDASPGDLSISYWPGSAPWDNVSVPMDESSTAPIANTKTVATGWLINGASTRSVIVYADATATTTQISYYTGNGSTFTQATDFNPGGTDPSAFRWFDIQMDPFNKDRFMLTLSDSNSDLWAKRAAIDATGNVTWTDSDSSAALETSLGQATTGDFSFAYWKHPAVYSQSAYRWYDNADSVQPGSSLANENTAASTSTRSPVRLRTQLTNSGMDQSASTQSFKLQYTTSSGAQADWCNAGSSCNTSWTARRKITFNNTASGENLTDFPVLIKLNSSRIDYSKTQSAGQDLRFIDSDNTTVLPHEIEEFNESGNDYVWVKVPQINQNVATDYIWMYYGNAGASDGQSVSSVWNSNYKGIWHVKESSGPTIADSTSNTNTGTLSGPTFSASGKIGNALNYDGSNDLVNAGSGASLDNLKAGTGLTTEAWINLDTLAGSTWGQIMNKAQDANPTTGWIFQADGNNPKLDFLHSGSTLLTRNSANNVLSTTQWLHVAASWDGSTTASNVKIYLNGTEVAYGTTNNGVTLSDDSAQSLTLGCDAPATANNCLDGLIDESRISSGVRSADWIEASYLSENDSMNIYSAEETQNNFGTWTDVADPWCNDASGITCDSNWTVRKKITFNNSASAENLTDFPVLIKLNSGRIDYSKTKSGGEDLRFVDPKDPTTVLPHEIEEFNETGDDYVWVKIPQLDAGSTGDYIWMYYGNASASSGVDAANVWDNGYEGVYHMSDNAANTNVAESNNSRTGTNAANTSTKTTTGQLNNALTFNGTTDRVTISNQTTALASGNLTYSAWFNFTSTFDNTVADAKGLVALADASSVNDADMYFGDADGSSQDGKLHIAIGNGAGGYNRADSTQASWTSGTWYHGAGTFSTTNGTRIYVNGAASGAGSGTSRGSTPTATTAYIGYNVSSVGTSNFPGKLDEVRLSSVARSADWIEAEYLSQVDSMASYGSEEAPPTSWTYYNNTTPASGAVITTELLSGTTAKENYVEAGHTEPNPNAIATGGKGEWDFALNPEKICGGTYYFRMVKDNGTALDSYTYYPQLTVDIAAPVDKAMRHGSWWSNDTKRPYSCEWVAS